MSKAIKAHQIEDTPRPKYSSWARAAGDVLEQNPTCRNQMAQM